MKKLLEAEPASIDRPLRVFKVKAIHNAAKPAMIGKDDENASLGDTLR